LSSPQGILFLFFATAMSLWLGSRMSDLSQALAVVHGPSVSVLETKNPIVDILSWFTDLSAARLIEMGRQYNALQMVLFAALLWFLPLSTLLLAADQTGSDVGTRHMRFLTTRTDRTSLFVGKFLAVWLFLAAAAAVAVVALTLVQQATPGWGGPAVSFGYALRIWVTCVLFALPFIALAAFGSALIGVTAMGLVVGVGLWLVVLLISFVGGIGSEEARHFRFLFPSALKYRWMSSDFADIAIVGAYHLGYALVLGMAGWLVFRRRDL
jgi:ABC-type transport system involved in multi-copper enzyme maturation permease subunit